MQRIKIAALPLLCFERLARQRCDPGRVNTQRTLAAHAPAGEHALFHQNVAIKQENTAVLLLAEMGPV